MAGGNKGATLQTRLKGAILSYPVADNVKIYRGGACGIAVATAGANHVLAATDHFIGMAEEAADNTGTGHALGAKKVRVRRKGIFRFEFARDESQGSKPAVIDFSVATCGCTVSEGAAGLTILTFEASAVVEYAAGDFIVIAGVTDVLGAPHMNGTWRVYSVVDQVVNIYKVYEACTAKLVVGTTTYYRSIPLTIDANIIGKAATLLTVQAATVEEQAGVMTVGETGYMVLGTIVKAEAVPSVYIWVDINPCAEAWQAAT